MYYLKYRPQKIADIDNEDRRQLLSNVFSKKNDIPHAFLLIGPKGTGKTSTARIIAKLLNCQNNMFGGKGTNPEPCGKCDNCIDFIKNRFLDVYELDAASNRGIDDIRTLRDGVGYSPVRGRFKVYIIDEVHMLTKEAFNALLKTLEEPGAEARIILVAPHTHSLASTIISRCQLVRAIEPPTTEDSNLARNTIGQLRSATIGTKITLSDSYKDRQHALTLINSLVHHFRHHLLTSQSKTNLVNLTLTLYTGRLLKQNVGVKLAVGHLFLRLKV